MTHAGGGNATVRSAVYRGIGGSEGGGEGETGAVAAGGVSGLLDEGGGGREGGGNGPAHVGHLEF